MRLTLTLFVLCSTLSWVSAQTRLVSGTFNGTFEQAIVQLEQSTGYHFYFNPKWTDSLTVSVTANQEPITDVLTKMLTGTELRFSIDSDNNVYIVYDRDIQTQLPPGFFSEPNQQEKKPGGSDTGNPNGNAVITGYVKDGTSGEAIVGASVYIESPHVGAVTDQFGYFSLTLPKGRHEILVSSVAMKSTRRKVMLYSNGMLNIELEQDVTPLKEIVITSERDARVAANQMGMERLDIRTMKQMPLALGETDIMKVVLMLPGVQSVGEGTVGLNIRGGASNQNLILYNDATVYNPSHLFGFFSTFNPDVLKNVELYKSGITADYGGRLSSVLDVHTREGNTKKLSGSGGISPITGRFTLEGPILKDRTSFLIGARTTYSNWILRKVDYKEIKDSEASFYDINLAISHKIDDNNNIYLSGYFSKDKFAFAADTSYSYSDKNASLKWKHIFNPKFYGVLTAGFSQYEYSLTGDKEIPINTFNMDFSVGQYNAKADFNYFPNEKHAVTAGIGSIRYNLSPGNYTPSGEASSVVPDQLQKEQGMESYLYAGDNYEISDKLSVYGGLRYSFFQTLGPKDVFRYSDGTSRREEAISDTVRHTSGAVATYSGIEPRFSMRYLLNKNTSLKVGYNRMRQYIQMISNTTAIAPTDIWKLSDNYFKPQIGDQYSVGIYRTSKNGLFEMSLEGYYKDIKSTIDFKNGAELLLNHHLETEISEATGKAYGVELLLKKNTGRLNGWITYTYSRTLLKVLTPYKNEQINNGDYYPANYDKPHSANFIGNYKFSRRFNFSLNVVYSTGRPLTVPLVKYEAGGAERVYYSERNQDRIDDYFRTDISINIEGNHKIKKLAHSSWTLAVYNLLGRSNPYSVYFTTEDGKIKAYQLSIFARPIPTITYNFKF